MRLCPRSLSTLNKRYQSTVDDGLKQGTVASVETPFPVESQPPTFNPSVSNDAPLTTAATDANAGDKDAVAKSAKPNRKPRKRSNKKKESKEAKESKEPATDKSAPKTKQYKVENKRALRPIFRSWPTQMGSSTSWLREYIEDSGVEPTLEHWRLLSKKSNVYRIPLSRQEFDDIISNVDISGVPNWTTKQLQTKRINLAKLKELGVVDRKPYVLKIKGNAAPNLWSSSQDSTLTLNETHSEDDLSYEAFFEALLAQSPAAIIRMIRTPYLKKLQLDYLHNLIILGVENGDLGVNPTGSLFIAQQHFEKKLKSIGISNLWIQHYTSIPKTKEILFHPPDKNNPVVEIAEVQMDGELMALERKKSALNPAKDAQEDTIVIPDSLPNEEASQVDTAHIKVDKLVELKDSVDTPLDHYISEVNESESVESVSTNDSDASFYGEIPQQTLGQSAEMQTEPITDPLELSSVESAGISDPQPTAEPSDFMETTESITEETITEEPSLDTKEAENLEPALTEATKPPTYTPSLTPVPAAPSSIPQVAIDDGYEYLRQSMMAGQQADSTKNKDEVSGDEDEVEEDLISSRPRRPF
ncbi:hypothetical protein H072_5834 [Dactylellina haptotyla CBS 200.50]|uniref:Uncharacterized protein n=1 Tax=Dactylellina haptotyla (strain CBS 200.50) TaxID=1284197 RepID=S8ABT4_DACHA|nr:hypothetical protein H072_5834 [Dactylellina haptotyla CBS 200.50]